MVSGPASPVRRAYRPPAGASDAQERHGEGEQEAAGQGHVSRSYGDGVVVQGVAGRRRWGRSILGIR